jgi:ribulose 1,5-bisphosphate carboxylase large subunit-like protein
MADAPGSAMPESIDDRDYVIATYLYRASTGTDIHRAAAAGAKAIRQAIDAAVRGEPLAAAGAAHAELGKALVLWPEMVALSESTTA